MALDRVDPPPSSSLASGDLTALRRNWLARALCCEPPALARAESAVAQIYSTCGRRRPRFFWVSSPLAATRLIDTDGLAERTTLTNGSTNTIVAAALSDWRRRLEATIPRRHLTWSPTRGTATSTRTWSSLSGPDRSTDDSAGSEIVTPLRASVFDGVAAAIRTLLPPLPGVVAWYGQHEAHRLALADWARRHPVRSSRRRQLTRKLKPTRSLLTQPSSPRAMRLTTSQLPTPQAAKRLRGKKAAKK